MKEKILIVEDEDIVAADIKEALESFGYGVCGRAISCETALSLVQEQKPDLILMDIKLEGDKDGVQTVAEIKSQFDIPVIYLTAYADDKTFARAKITEPYGYILKPFKEMELKMAVELALHRHSEALSDSGDVVSSESIELTPESEELLAILKRVNPFSRGDEDALRRLAQVARSAKSAAGDMLAFEGEEKESGFVVVSGRVALVKASPSGKDLIVELLAPGDPFGLLATFDQPNYQVAVRTQVDSELLWVPRSEVLAFLEKHPDLNKEFLREVFERLRRSHDFSRALAHDRVEVRIAYALVSLMPKFAEAVPGDSSLAIEMSRQEMAEYVGATPETVTRSMRTMEKDGLLDLKEAGYVKVLSMDGLSELADI